tara:strand:- start:2232 stop:3623 length:1392 start_codon:yes stop_codon:yes gene_type:complete
MNAENNSLVVYELNEVPKKVLDYYISRRPKSNLSRLCKTGLFKITYTNDEGELHPWSTWPSVHRGVTNGKHNIKFLNQDKNCAKSYPPIWEILEKSGLTIGIFGSLQTYPPYKSKNVDFFVPDTFAPASSSIPTDLELFQRFNLSLARKNKAYAGNIKILDLINLFKIIKKGLVSIKTLLKVFIHLMKEFCDSRYKKRRANIQAMFSFDAYKIYLQKYKPNYSTFFTNHIAANMHRYWLHTFPEDFDINDKQNIKDAGFHSLSILKAMDIADKQIGFLMEFQESRGGAFLVVSGLGQEAIVRKEYQYDLYLENDKKFLETFGLDKRDYKFLPSMYPDINISCKNQECLLLLLKKVKSLRDHNGNKILRQRYDNKGNTLNLVIESKIPLGREDNLVIEKKYIKPTELGFILISRDNGTGYHVKEGIFISNSNFKNDLNKRFFKNQTQLDICNIFEMTLNYFNVN